MAITGFSSKRWVKVAALAGASCLALTACGGSDSAGGGSASGGGSSSSGDKIVIGYVASESGPQAQNGLVGVATAKAWAEATNADGGINGQMVEIQDTDSKSAVPSATAAFKKYQGDDSVDAIMVTDLIAEGALGDVFKDAGVPVLSGGATFDPIWYGTPGLYQPVSGSSVLPALYVAAAKAGDATKLGFAACAEVASCAEAAAPTQALASADGIDDAGTQTFSATATDYTAQCLAFKDADADAIAMNIGIDTGVNVMASCLQQGFKGNFIMPNSGFDQTKVDGVDGATSIDVTQGFPWWADSERAQAYRDATDKYSDQPSTGGQATSVWAMLELLKKSLTDANPSTIDRDTVTSSLDAVKDETLDGLLAQPITFTADAPSPAVNCSWVFKYSAGDDNPTTIAPTDTSGNGADGDLASTCVSTG